MERTQTKLSNSVFQRSFMHAAPTLWNNSSQDTRMLDFVQFKSRNKTELYLLLFCILSCCQRCIIMLYLYVLLCGLCFT